MVEGLSILLESTGLDIAKARFQVLTLLTAVGYSTRESEIIANHPVRRKIASFTMLLGYLNNMVLFSFVVNLFQYHFEKTQILPIAICLAVLVLFLRYRYKVDFIIKILFSKNKWFKQCKNNINFLLSSKNDYGLYSICVDNKFKYLNQEIQNTDLSIQGIQILNIDKGDKFIPSPEPNYIIEKGEEF